MKALLLNVKIKHGFDLDKSHGGDLSPLCWDIKTNPLTYLLI